MSNTHNHPFLRSVTAAFLVWGILLIAGSSAEMVSASVTGQGSSVVGLAVGTGQSVPVPAEVVKSLEMQMQLIIGMLMVLAGFAFHALTVLRGARRRKTARRRAPRFTAIIHKAFRARSI
jgi:hypothetical protein